MWHLVRVNTVCDSFNILDTSTGPSCSKLKTSLVNDSLKFALSDTQIC